jgi:hypothetical protein
VGQRWIFIGKLWFQILRAIEILRPFKRDHYENETAMVFVFFGNSVNPVNSFGAGGECGWAARSWAFIASAA